MLMFMWVNHMLDVRWQLFNKPFVVFMINPRLNSTPLRGYVRVRTVQNSTVSENYKRWKGQMDVYLAASNASAKDGKVQTAIILNCAGRHLYEVYKNIAQESDDDKHHHRPINTPHHHHHRPIIIRTSSQADKVLGALENHCNSIQ